MPEGRESYDPQRHLSRHGYVVVKKKPKDLSYQGVGELGSFYYSRKNKKTYIMHNRKLYALRKR